MSGSVSSLQCRVLVECAVDIVRAFLGVDDTGAEGLFAMRPADEVFGGRLCQVFKVCLRKIG